MRILLISDIHANWPALQALQEPYDYCICLGDLVDYCLEPAPCIAWIKQHAQFSVRGNHDHGAAQNVVVNAQNGFKWLTSVTRPLTRARLSVEDRHYLAGLPLTKMVMLDELRFFLVHATPRDPLDEPAPPSVDFWTKRLQGIEADVICVGHTHQPYILEVGDKLVVNPGSLGLPRDGDPRASYALFENRRLEIKRIEYPVEETIAAIQASTLPDAAKAMLAAGLRTGFAPRPASA